MFGVALAALAFIFLIATLRAASWAARDWLILVTVYALLASALIALHYRRRAEEVHQLLHEAAPGRWRRQHTALHWPKVCVDCSMKAHSWSEMGRHDDPARSSCAHHVLHVVADEDEQALPGGHDGPVRQPGSQWTATVVDGSDSEDEDQAAAVEAIGQAAVEAAEDLPALEVLTTDQLQARADQRADSWARIDALVERTSRRRP